MAMRQVRLSKARYRANKTGQFLVARPRRTFTVEKVLSVMDRAAIEAIDLKLMARCIELSKTAGKEGEFPFACVIAKDGEVVVETTNRVKRDGDLTRHAEIVAVGMAQRALGTKDLSGCTLYTNVEPCAMCSFPIRETRISRVVYSIGSRLMGGDSKWDILGDEELTKVMPEAFGDAPEVVRGLLRRDAEKAWRNWNPLIWGVIRYRGCFGDPAKEEPVTARPVHKRSLLAKIFAPHG
jgi:tRNA(adenine34) deaminase